MASPFNFINILAKEKKKQFYTKNLSTVISQNFMSNLAEIWESSLVCLLSAIGPTLISNRATSICL